MVDQETSKKKVTENQQRGVCILTRNTRRVCSVELDENELSSKGWMINEPKSMSNMQNKCQNVRSSGDIKGRIIHLQMAQQCWSLQTMKNRQNVMDNNDDNAKTEVFTDYTKGLITELTF